MSITIGVLDIQGSVEEHLSALKKIGAQTVSVKTRRALDGVDGLIIPGGESTTIGKLLKRYRLDVEIRNRASMTMRHAPGAYKPLTVWGTCAGAILLAKKVSQRKPDTIGIMDIAVKRNAYGRQLESFETELRIFNTKVPALFIRAPQVEKTSREVEILAQYAGKPVMVRQGNLLATMFHPELTADSTVHRYFVSLVKNYAAILKKKTGRRR